MQFAPQMAPQIGVSTDVVVTAHDIVCSMMGSPWIEEQAQRSYVPPRSIADVHPLFRALTGGTELNIIEVCELAALLVAFKSDAKLGESIIALRDADKYEATVMELSIASKFQIAGARVALAPPTQRGTADFAADVEGKEHLVEVSGFPNDPFRSDSMAFVGAMQGALKSGLKRSGLTQHVAVEIDVADSEVDLRRETHKAVVQTMEAYAKGRGEQVKRDFAFGSVNVRKTVPGEKPDTRYWTAAVCLQLVPPPTTGLLTMSNLRRGEETHWLYVRLPTLATDSYERIRRKLKTEARQLSGSQDGVVLLDSGGLRSGIFSGDDEKLRGVAADFKRQHESTTGVGIIARPLKRDGTRGLAGAYFPLAAGALSLAFWRRMLEMDGESSILWELEKLRK
jgi:hypothetical protein